MFLSFSSVYFITVILVVRLQLVERSGGSKRDINEIANVSGLFLPSLKVIQTSKMKFTQTKTRFVLTYRYLVLVGWSALSCFINFVKGLSWPLAFLWLTKMFPWMWWHFGTNFSWLKNIKLSSILNSMENLFSRSSIIKGASILGSAYGGWALSSKFNTSPKTLLLRFVTLRSLCILLQLWIISNWEKVMFINILNGIYLNPNGFTVISGTSTARWNNVKPRCLICLFKFPDIRSDFI